MTPAESSRAPVDDPFIDADDPFTYVGGDPSLDFVNTADWHAKEPCRDRLAHYDRWVEWSVGAGVLDARVAARLRVLAAERKVEAEAAVRSARDLRQRLKRIFDQVATGSRDPSAVEAFNRHLHGALSHLRLETAPSGLRYTWLGWGEVMDCPLWPVVRCGAALLVSDEAARIRMCDGDDCGWVFVDRSRNGRRRWCEMATCGTTAKNRRRRRDSG